VSAADLHITGLTPVGFDADAHAAACAEYLRGHPDYRVLRKFVPRTRYNEEPWHLGDRTHVKIGAFVDVEATGLDVEKDEVIELGIVPFAYDAARRIVYDVLPSLSYFNEPTRPITLEITDITGITPAMVAGQRIAAPAVQAELTAALSQCSIIFAHKADYDRPMCERVHPAFAALPWACTLNEIDWRAFGVNGGALGNILMSACGEFAVDAHRATNDCHVGVHVLAAAQLEGKTALSMILESARDGAHRVCALNSPMWTKDMLRARRYRALYSGGRFCYWYKDVRKDDVDEELDWCRQEAGADPVVRQISAKDRYSARADR
jgi:DNA polymerase-3 subunit epsilon